MKAVKSARISTDLGDPQLIRLLKREAELSDLSIREVMVNALRTYFFHRIESRALMRAAEEVFTEWNDPRDSDYDAL
jgi:hypothetical protein